MSDTQLYVIHFYVCLTMLLIYLLSKINNNIPSGLVSLLFATILSLYIGDSENIVTVADIDGVSLSF